MASRASGSAVVSSVSSATTFVPRAAAFDSVVAVVVSVVTFLVAVIAAGFLVSNVMASLGHISLGVVSVSIAFFHQSSLSSGEELSLGSVGDVNSENDAQKDADDCD